jgi:hypothetical protein
LVKTKSELASRKQLEKVKKGAICRFEFLAKRMDKLNRRILEMEAKLNNYTKPIKIPI